MAGLEAPPAYAAVADRLAALNPTWEQTMLRIKDPKVSIPFYEEHFGMTLVKEFHFGEGKGDFSLFFLASLTEAEKEGLPAPDSPEAIHSVFDCRKGQAHLELTWNHGTETKSEDDMPLRDHAERPQIYHNGNSDPRGFGHIAFNVADVYAASAELEAKGVKFKKKPDEGRMKGLAFALDPDGYWIEIVQGSQTVEPGRYNLSQTMIRIKDPAVTVPFYTSLFDMELVSERHFDPEKGDFSLYFLVTKSDAVKKLQDDGAEVITKHMWDPALELTHNHGDENQDGPVYHNGNSTDFPGMPDGKAPKGFGHIGFLVDDLDEFCDLLAQANVEFIKKPQDGSMRGLAFAKDPTGYWIEIIQRGVKGF